MNILSPAEWGSAVDYDSWADRKWPWEGIAIHHGGGGEYPAHQLPYSQAKEAAQLRAWEQYHLSRGWRGLAYNWGVGMTGTVYRIRGRNVSGAHLGDIDNDGIPNSREIPAVIFIMSGHHRSPSADMLQSFETLRAELETTEGHGLWLWGHKEIQLAPPTTCPGPLVMPYVETHRESIVPGPTQRIAGNNRYDTATLIADYPWDASQHYIIAADGSPDALSAGGAPAIPILLTQPNRLPPNTAAWIAANKQLTPVIVGGTAAVGVAVESGNQPYPHRMTTVTFDEIHLSPIGATGDWELDHPWTVHISGPQGRYVFVFEARVPAGFTHDRASIPWFLLTLIQGKDTLGAAGPLLHDWLYCSHRTNRATADKFFRVVMAADGVKRWRRNLAWLAVRVGGFVAWGRSFRKGC